MLQLELLELRNQQQEMERFLKEEQRSDKESRYARTILVTHIRLSQSLDEWVPMNKSTAELYTEIAV